MSDEYKNCPICQHPASIVERDNAGPLDVKCYVCGSYTITQSAYIYLIRNQLEENTVKLKFWLYKRTNEMKKLVLSINSLKLILEKIELPKPKEQADLLLEWLGDLINPPDLKYEFRYLQAMAVIGAYRHEGYRQIYEHLKEVKLIQDCKVIGGNSIGTLSIKGWDKYEEIKKNVNNGSSINLNVGRVQNYENPFGNVNKEKEESLSKTEYFQSIITKGENKVVEFKTSLRFCIKRKSAPKLIEHSTFKNIAAFLNTEGGTLLIGVGDDGEIVGLEETDYKTFKEVNKKDAFLKHFDNLVKNYFGNDVNQYISIEMYQMDGKTIAVVEVRSKAAKPIVIKKEGKEQFYIRRNASAAELTMTEFFDYCKEHWK